MPTDPTSPEAIAEARALLATTTLPAELHVARIAETFQGAPMLVGYRVTFVPDGDPCRCFGCMGQIDNARLLANAPTWLAQLLAELAQAEVDKRILDAGWTGARAVAETLRAEMAQLLAALEAERVARANTQQRLTAAQDLLDAVSDEMVSFTAEWHAPEIVAAFAALDALTDPDGRIDR